jgi:hypothetical protein
MAFNFGGASAGGLGGAGTGAAIGSSFLPGLGTAIGAGAGGLAGFLSGGLGGGKEGKFKQKPMSDQEQQIMQYLLGSGLQGLQNPYEGFQPIQDYATNQFNTDIIPGLAERFSSFGGSGGGQRSSAFQGALGQAGAGLAQNLALLKSQYGQQNQQNSLQRLQMGLGQQQQGQYYRPSETGFGENILDNFRKSLPQILQYLQAQQQNKQQTGNRTQLASQGTQQQQQSPMIQQSLNNPLSGFQQPQLSQNYFQSLLQPQAPTMALLQMMQSLQQQPQF